jgi:hypothetical protein
MHDCGLKFKPDPKKGFDCCCDADFSGHRNKEFAPVNPSTTKWMDNLLCRMPVSWASKLQSQIALSTTKAKYIAIAMSQALRDIIPIMNLLQEMRE